MKSEEKFKMFLYRTFDIISLLSFFAVMTIIILKILEKQIHL